MEFQTKVMAIKDFKLVGDWITKRQITSWDLEDAPHFGLLCMFNNIPVCAGFIRRVEGGFCMIDGVITDPDQPKSLRNDALNVLTEELIGWAKHLKIKGIIINSSDKNTIERSLRFGFKKLPDQFLLAKDMKEEK